MRSKTAFFRIDPVIQYIWIGKPVTQISEEPQLDILGPIQMAEALIDEDSAQFIVFYCLDSAVRHFSQLYLQYPNILVRSIDFLFESSITDKSEGFLRQAKLIFDKDKLGGTRSRVDAKNLASLMLLYLRGGYYLDTTVFPNNTSLNFKVYDGFVVPLLSEDRSNRLITYRAPDGGDFIIPYFRENDGSPESQFAELLDDFEELGGTSRNHMIDVFVLFSPKNHNAVARAITTYVLFFPYLQVVRENGTVDEIAEVADSLIDTAVNNGYFGDKSKKSNKWLTPIIVTEENQVRRQLDYIGCYKVFAGSHIVEEPSIEQMSLV
jgi:hypothetical protein